MTPPTRNITAAKISTGRLGSWASSPPTVTATSGLHEERQDTPIHTYSGRNRVASTSVAMNVLSGSSTRKIEPKTMAMVARSKSISRRLYPRRPNTLTGCPTPRPSPRLASRSPSLALVVAVLAVVRLGRGPRRAARDRGPAPGRHAATSRPCGPTSPRRCGTSRSCATTRSVTWVGGCRSAPPSSTTAGDGLVFSSIHARGESRTYAKGIVGGGSDATLTPEEQQALAAARTGSQGGLTP